MCDFHVEFGDSDEHDHGFQSDPDFEPHHPGQYRAKLVKIERRLEEKDGSFSTRLLFRLLNEASTELVFPYYCWDTPNAFMSVPWFIGNVAGKFLPPDDIDGESPYYREEYVVTLIANGPDGYEILHFRMVDTPGNGFSRLPVPSIN